MRVLKLATTALSLALLAGAAVAAVHATTAPEKSVCIPESVAHVLS
jgi:hypothetical protein